MKNKFIAQKITAIQRYMPLGFLLLSAFNFICFASAAILENAQQITQNPLSDDPIAPRIIILAVVWGSIFIGSILVFLFPSPIDKEQTGEALSASPCSCPPESRDSTGLGDTCDRVEVFEDPTNNNENPCDEENPEQPPSEKESSVGPLRRRNNECARILHRSWMMSR